MTAWSDARDRIVAIANLNPENPDLFSRVWVQTPELIALVRRLSMGECGECEIGGYAVPWPGTGRRRPFGNSDIELDMRDILGYGTTDIDDVDDVDDDEGWYLHILFRHVLTALRVVLQTGRFTPGVYAWRESRFYDGDFIASLPDDYTSPEFAAVIADIRSAPNGPLPQRLIDRLLDLGSHPLQD